MTRIRMSAHDHSGFPPAAMGLRRRSLRSLCLFLLAFVFAAGALTARADEGIEAAAYREMAAADHLRDAGRARAALRRYARAEQMFRRIQENHPDYKPATMEFRIGYLRTQIERLESGADTEPEPDWEALATEARTEAAQWQEQAEALSRQVQELESAPEDPRLREQADHIGKLEAELERRERRIRRLEEQAAPPPERMGRRRRRDEGVEDPPGPEVPAAAETEAAEPAVVEEAHAEPEDPALNAGAMLSAALAALDEGQPARARRMLDEILVRDPEARRRGVFRRQWTGGPAEVRFALARALNTEGDARAAQALLDDLIKEHPDRPAYLRLRARIERERGRHKTAAGFFRLASEANPDCIDTRFDLATALHHAGALEEASDAYRQVLAAHPDHELAHFNRALILVQGDEASVEKARTHYQRSLELGGQADDYMERRLNP